MVEGAPLLRAYGSKAHRGFESLPLRQTLGKFSSVWISWLSQRRSGDSNPRYGKGGSTKSPKAILDVAAQLRRSGAKRRTSGEAVSNPSLSARRSVNCCRFRSVGRGGNEAGITPVRAAPKGRGAQRRVIPPSPPRQRWAVIRRQIVWNGTLWSVW